jgi:hypothetical protein
MTTLTLDQLCEDAHRLSLALGGHYPTNITSLELDTRKATASCAELEEALETIKSMETTAEEEAEEMHKLRLLIDEKGREIERLTELLQEKEEGKTLLEWVAEAKEAKKMKEAFQQYAEELLALIEQSK